jgi:DhnA family fructose-bisphosphate aldolase class Ia
MLLGKILRLRRIFTRGNTLIVAIDHGKYWGTIRGIEKPIELVRMIAESEADGIMATPSIIELVGNYVGNLTIIARLDGGTTIFDDLTEDRMITTVEHAISLGVDAGCVMCYIGCKKSPLLQQKVGLLATECAKFGLPLMVESLPAKILQYHFIKDVKTLKKHEETRETLSLDDIMVVSRIAIELGADIIKTYYTGTVEEYKKIIEYSPVPIVIAGGPKTQTDEEFLMMIKNAMNAGAKGIVMGRNIWQHKNPKGMIKALSKIIHDGKDVSEAIKFL